MHHNQWFMIPNSLVRTQCFPWLDSGVCLHEAVVWTDLGAGHTEPALIRQI